MDEDLTKVLARLRKGVDEVSETLEKASGRVVELTATLVGIADYLSETLEELAPDEPVQKTRQDKVQYIQEHASSDVSSNLWSNPEWVAKWSDSDIDFVYNQMKLVDEWTALSSERH